MNKVEEWVVTRTDGTVDHFDPKFGFRVELMESGIMVYHEPKGVRKGKVFTPMHRIVKVATYYE